MMEGGSGERGGQVCSSSRFNGPVCVSAARLPFSERSWPGITSRRSTQADYLGT